MSAQYTPVEKLDYLLGRIRALSTTVGVLVGARPDAEHLLAKIDNLLAELVDRSFGEALTDAHEAGLSDFRAKLAETVATVQAHRK